VSKTTKSKTARQVSRAELKAYEARRAEEGHRVAAPQLSGEGTAAPSATATRRVYVLTRDEEYKIIRGDLRRLLLIVAILVLVLIVATLILR